MKNQAAKLTNQIQTAAGSASLPKNQRKLVNLNPGNLSFNLNSSGLNGLNQFYPSNLMGIQMTNMSGYAQNSSAQQQQQSIRNPSTPASPSSYMQPQQNMNNNGQQHQDNLVNQQQLKNNSTENYEPQSKLIKLGQQGPYQISKKFMTRGAPAGSYGTVQGSQHNQNILNGNNTMNNGVSPSNNRINQLKFGNRKFSMSPPKPIDADLDGSGTLQKQIIVDSQQTGLDKGALMMNGNLLKSVNNSNTVNTQNIVIPGQLNQMTLDVSQERRQANRKLNKIDLANRRYSNPNEYENNTLDDSANALLIQQPRPVTSKNGNDIGQNSLSKSFNKKLLPNNNVQLIDQRKQNFAQQRPFSHDRLTNNQQHQLNQNIIMKQRPAQNMSRGRINGGSLQNNNINSIEVDEQSLQQLPSQALAQSNTATNQDYQKLMQDQIFKHNPNVANLSFKNRKHSDQPQHDFRLKKLSLNGHLNNQQQPQYMQSSSAPTSPQNNINLIMQQRKLQQKQNQAGSLQQNQTMQLINGQLNNQQLQQNQLPNQNIQTNNIPMSRGAQNPTKKFNNFLINPSMIEDHFSPERSQGQVQNQGTANNGIGAINHSKRIKIQKQQPQSQEVSPNRDIKVQQQFQNTNSNPINPSQNPIMQGKIQKPMTNNLIKQFFGEVKNVVTKFAFATRVGFIPNNPYKTNQDSFILAPNLLNQPALHYFGVCDGHGQYGKEVSNYVKTSLPQNLEEDLKSLVPNIHQSLKNSFVKCNGDLLKNTPDPQYSGTTCCTVLLNGTKVYSANSGDSRAIIVNKFGKAKQLSRDHKPSDPDESQRIKERGGRIEAFKDFMTGEEMGPQRVWLMSEDVPGLAMSRSLGDYVAQSVGVIPEPEILEYEIVPDDIFMVIASDGIWEFMPNEDVAKISLPFYAKSAPEAAANALVKEAYKKWKQEEEVIDDITCVIVFFDEKLIQNSIKAKNQLQQHDQSDKQQQENGNLTNN